ncbi:hypothetical protein SCHPADRAFT_106208 [Schizopora paradoxa]|uniref:Uncharacterized protein n=1 Tax=Schizopora paradoxa TaxID=27342 RepID=A0A0H2S305_9AGAM|nr:hypothetical protein SCHPADRAFT_106208 [Schizopora paradoxa]
MDRARKAQDTSTISFPLHADPSYPMLVHDRIYPPGAFHPSLLDHEVRESFFSILRFHQRAHPFHPFFQQVRSVRCGYELLAEPLRRWSEYHESRRYYTRVLRFSVSPHVRSLRARHCLKFAIKGQDSAIYTLQKFGLSFGLDRSICVAKEPRGQGEYVWYIDLYWQRVLSLLVFASFRISGFWMETEVLPLNGLPPSSPIRGITAHIWGLWTSSETLSLLVRVQRGFEVFLFPPSRY